MFLSSSAYLRSRKLDHRIHIETHNRVRDKLSFPESRYPRFGHKTMGSESVVSGARNFASGTWCQRETDAQTGPKTNISLSPSNRNNESYAAVFRFRGVPPLETCVRFTGRRIRTDRVCGGPGPYRRFAGLRTAFRGHADVTT